MRFVVEISHLKREYALIAIDAPSERHVKSLNTTTLHDHATRLFGDEWPSVEQPVMVLEHRIVDIQNYPSWEEDDLPVFEITETGHVLAPTDEAERRLTQLLRHVLDRNESLCLDDPEDKGRLLAAIVDELMKR